MTTTGDLLLLGSGDPVSRIIQHSLGSPYSHVAVVVEGQRIVEAYDHELTLSEEDEGVFKRSLDEFVEREDKVNIVTVLRNTEALFDPERFSAVANTLVNNTPTYPTTAAALMLLGRITGRVAGRGEDRLLTPSAKTIRRQAIHFGDGPMRMHCAELALRLYAAAGGALELRKPLLHRYMDVVKDQDDYDTEGLHISLDSGSSPAKPGIWRPQGVSSRPAQLLISTTVAVTDLANSVVNRYVRRPEEAQSDLGDFGMPPDLLTAKELSEVGTFFVRRGRCSIGRMLADTGANPNI